MNSLTRILFRTKAFPNFSSRVCEGTVKLKVVSHCPRYETLSQKNRRRRCPLSPHLTIYKSQLTTILSISHRISGICLVSYSTLFGLSGLCCSHEISHYITMIEGLEIGNTTLFLMRFMLAFPFAFHTSTGIRHLIWDTGNFLEMNKVYLTGYIAMGSAITIAGLLALC